MNRLIDVDNETAVILTPVQMQSAKKIIDGGTVTDCVGEVMIWDEVIDGGGDLCLDEDAFDQVSKLLPEKYCGICGASLAPSCKNLCADCAARAKEI